MDDDGLAVVKQLEERLGLAVRIAVERVAGIEQTAGGKFCAVVNRCRGGVSLSSNERVEARSGNRRARMRQ